MELFKLLDVKEVIVQAINFFLVLFLLRVFLWKKVLKVLDDRKERIALEFKNIEALKQQVAGIKADYDAKMLSAQAEGKKRIQDAVEKARVEAEEIRSQAQREAQDIIENAKMSMRHDIADARQALRKELVDLTILATENLIEEKLTEDQDKRIVEDFLKEIDAGL
ncbi:MAG: F0F1 ATP synthase subunit B [Candidatus Omnitrophota bacterium]|jgi:F-type H+-transporting ATPase subunit b